MLPPFSEITDEQCRKNRQETETQVAEYMFFDVVTGLSTGDYYPHWYGGYVCPGPQGA